jgi:hypothetical protein
VLDIGAILVEYSFLAKAKQIAKGNDSNIVCCNLRYCCVANEKVCLKSIFNEKQTTTESEPRVSLTRPHEFGKQQLRK